MQEINLEDNIEKLKNKYKLPGDLINKILYNHDSYHPIAISTILASIDDIDEENKLCEIIETLNRNLGISYETLAAFGEINMKELEEFLKDPESLIEKKKFILAVRIMFLHFVLKEKYTIDTNGENINKSIIVGEYWPESKMTKKEL